MPRKYFLNIQIKLFQAIGFDIDVFTKKTLKSAPLLTLVTMGPLFLFIMPLGYYLIQNVMDVLKFTDALSWLLQGFLSVLKLILFIYHKKKFTKLIARIHQLLEYESKHNQEYDEIVQQENRSDKIMCLIFCSFCYITGVTALMVPFIKMGLAHSQTGSTLLILPFPGIYPYNTQNLKNYIFTFLWSLVTVYSVITSSLAVDTLISSYTHNVCAHFRIAQKKIESLNPKNLFNSESLVHQFNKIFRFHQDALEISEELRIAFQPLIFAQLFFSSAQICVVCYQSAAKLHDPDITYLIVFMISAMLQVFIVSYCGERLKSESMAFADAIYCGLWYEFNTKLARSLIIPIARAQRPCKLDGYFFEAGLPTFSSIISTALSYIALLNSFED